MGGRNEGEGPGDRRELRAALFVDFDNMCISFDELDPLAAHRFATLPARWLAWFESGAHARNDGDQAEPVRRRILVRKCYLNPVTFGRYRGDYTRAAFTVVDCPPLTQRGKTSADVYMVMDILDALDHKTEFDEFIILSSDADFTPVLLRLRAFDRRTTILATNLAAATYKAACDLTVPYERFFEEALGIEEDPTDLPHLGQAPTTAGGAGSGGGGASTGYEGLLPRVARALKERVAVAGALGPRDVSPNVFATFPEFRNSDWFGRYSLKGLMTRLLELEPDLQMLGDPTAAWTVRLRDVAPPAPTQGGVVSNGRVVADEAGPTTPAYAPPGPSADGGAVPPEPDRYERALTEAATADRLREFPEDLAAFIGRVADATGVPALSREEYGRLFRAIAEAAAEPDLDFNGRAGRVRDRLGADGFPVSRAQVNSFLNVYRSNRVETTGRDAQNLALAWRDIVLAALRAARFDPSAEELRLLDRWLLDAPDEAPATDGVPAAGAGPGRAGAPYQE